MAIFLNIRQLSKTHKMKNTTYAIYTLGCKVNQYDSNTLRNKLDSAGFKFSEHNALFAIVNTCAVTKTAASKSGQMVNKAKKENPKAKIILTGCWPKAYEKDVRDAGKADYIFKSGEEKKIIKLLESFTDLKRGKLPLKKTNPIGGRCRYFIKIQDGCEQFCSYCVIPYTRGKLKSRGVIEVIAEIKSAIGRGYQEIVLAGIHLGLYGTGKKINLAQLIEKILKINGVGRIRLSSIEPMEVNSKIMGLIKKNRKMCPHLHIPLQSGSDKILKLMNRPYDRKRFAEKVKQIRKEIPEIALSTDVIVGFPGETADDFKQTYQFVQKMKFSRLHVFSFSAHKKTPAFNLPNRVDAVEIKERSRKLRILGKKLEKDYIKKITSSRKELEVIAERRKASGYSGKTQYYFDLEFEEKNIAEKIRGKNLIGKIVNVKLPA